MSKVEATSLIVIGRLVLIWFFLPTLALRAEVIVGPWTPLFKGVEFATGEADESEPILQKVQVLRVDLTDPDIEFLSTPSDDSGGEDTETISETTSEFLVRHELQVAINANFFAPCCSLTPEGKDLLGLAMSEGEVVSPATSSGTGTEVLLITADNQATITQTTGSFNPEPYWTAVAGSDIVVQNGVARTNFGSSDFITNTHPRTAVGITKNGRYLLLMTIDGRRPGHSLGAPMWDVAQWLVRFGAHSGLNLDGGGSTTMAMEGEDGPVLLNTPSGSRERMLGNSIGLWAAPLPLTIVSAPQSQTVLLGQQINLSVEASGPEPISYQWRFHGVDIPEATTNHYSIPNADFVNDGEYSVVVSDVNNTNILNATITVTDEIIVTADQAQLSGSWTISTSSTEKFSSHFFYALTVSGTPTAEAYFVPTMPVAGFWDVSIWYPAGPNRSVSVPVILSSEGGTLYTNLNQTTAGGMWHQLALRHRFAAGTNGYVYLSNDTAEQNRLVIADAVRFKYRPYPDEPVEFTTASITNNALRLTLHGPTGYRHAIEASTNLTDWMAVTNFIMPTNGFLFLDAEATGFSRRFYRTRVAP